MALWRLHYHMVWATRDRLPLITDETEPALYGFLIGKADALGCIVHAVGGMPDHLHIVASIPPTLAIAQFVKHMKGSSSHHLTHGMDGARSAFAWQAGYGVFSLGPRQVPRAVAHVQHQKTHHSQGSAIPAMERDHEDADGPGLHRGPRPAVR